MTDETSNKIYNSLCELIITTEHPDPEISVQVYALVAVIKMLTDVFNYDTNDLAELTGKALRDKRTFVRVDTRLNGGDQRWMQTIGLHVE